MNQSDNWVHLSLTGEPNYTLTLTLTLTLTRYVAALPGWQKQRRMIVGVYPSQARCKLQTHALPPATLPLTPQVQVLPGEPNQNLNPNPNP